MKEVLRYFLFFILASFLGSFMYKFLALGANQKLNVIKKKLNKSDVDFTIRKLSDLEIYISKGDVHITLFGENILDFDYVWLTSLWISRSIAYAVSLFLQKNGVNFSPVEEEKSKLVDMLLFGLEGINLPDTYFTDVNNIEHKLTSIVGFCGYPFVIKPTRGCQGKGIHLVNSEQDFKEIVPKLDLSEQYLCQRFIPNNFDYRLIVAHGKVVSVVKRVRGVDTFRNNTHLGAEEFFMNIFEVPQKIIRLAQRSTASLNLSWSGVDVVTNMETGKNYVLEMNRKPGLTLGSTEISAAYDHILGVAKLNTEFIQLI